MRCLDGPPIVLRMIVTTTDTVDGYRIVRYFEPVVVNLVAGTDFQYPMERPDYVPSTMDVPWAGPGRERLWVPPSSSRR